jgi:hypothetical protein
MLEQLKISEVYKTIRYRYDHFRYWYEIYQLTSLLRIKAVLLCPVLHDDTAATRWLLSRTPQESLRYESMPEMVQTAFHEKVPGGGALVRFGGGGSLLLGGLKGCYWWKTV